MHAHQPTKKQPSSVAARVSGKRYRGSDIGEATYRGSEALVHINCNTEYVDKYPKQTRCPPPQQTLRTNAGKGALSFRWSWSCTDTRGRETIGPCCMGHLNVIPSVLDTMSSILNLLRRVVAPDTDELEVDNI